MVRRYEDLRAVLFHASNQLRGLALLVGSADVKGSELWVKEDERRELRIREEYASCRVYRVYPVFFSALYFFYESFACFVALELTLLLCENDLSALR